MDLRIFRLPSVLAVIGGKFCWQAPTRCPSILKRKRGSVPIIDTEGVLGGSNYTSYSFTQWAPTIFADVLGCTPMQTAQCATYRPLALLPCSVLLLHHERALISV